MALVAEAEVLDQIPAAAAVAVGAAPNERISFLSHIPKRKQSGVISAGDHTVRRKISLAPTNSN